MRDENLDVAIEVNDATFTWDGPPPEVDEGKKRKGKKDTSLEKAAKAAAAALAVEQAKVDEEKVFRMSNLTFSIPRGKLVAIVGPVRGSVVATCRRDFQPEHLQVGSGKTSLLQGVIGEMRRTSGYTKFGGSVSYCPQSAWIQVIIIRHILHLLKSFSERHNP